MKRLFAAMTAALLMAALVPAAASGRGPLPITGAGHAIAVPDYGTCGNVWATDSLDKAYKLTRVTATRYNLELKEDGTFTTHAGVSPGACESGTKNGHTVVAGVTGTTHQEFNAIVTSDTAPNSTPNCAANACASSSSFLNAVFGSGGWARDPWSFTGHYRTSSNGTWFDTSVNWPLNDRGDITS